MPTPVSRIAYRSRIPLSKVPLWKCHNARSIVTDSKNRLTTFWAPTGGISAQDEEPDESHALLIRGGFLRQAHSGVFHLLPLGLRVQNKLEALIDKHMRSISASKVSMSAITTEELWKQSGRYSANSELLRVQDRRESGFLLSPTHEEEITALVASMVHSYKDLPLRLYQTGRKYRDEKRPRQGLLRAKEFVMKDLYTFDQSPEAALKTYGEVRKAYNSLFDELKLPYLVADADSGNMGGKLSHEYHFISPKGEDNVWTCDACDYVANEELVEKRPSAPSSPKPEELIFQTVTTDHKTAINIHIPAPPNTPSSKISLKNLSSYINLHAVKRALPSHSIATSLDPSTLPSLLSKTTNTITLHDTTLHPPHTPHTHDLTATHPGAHCPRCDPGTLTPHPAIEVAHTFHLGTRYSEPLSALISLPSNTAARSPMHMGCHGIGVSRLLGAAASLLASPTGLAWPRAIAPFEVAVLSGPHVHPREVEGVYDVLERKGWDVVLDDREEKGLGWKMRDADLIGYPVVVVLGRGWREKRVVEVQCGRLGVRREVTMEEVEGTVGELLGRL